MIEETYRRKPRNRIIRTTLNKSLLIITSRGYTETSSSNLDFVSLNMTALCPRFVLSFGAIVREAEESSNQQAVIFGVRPQRI